MKKMKIFCRPTITIGLILFGIFLMPSAALSQKGSKKIESPKEVRNKNPTLDSVLKVLVESFAQYRNVEKENLWKLSEASVDLNTTTQNGIEGGLKLFVFSVGGSKSVENSSTLSIKLSLPNKKFNPEQPVNFMDVKTEIARALELAQTAVKDAEVGDLKSEMTYELKFTVTWKIEGGVNIPDLIPVELSAKRSKAKTQVHTLKVVFK